MLPGLEHESVNRKAYFFSYLFLQFLFLRRLEVQNESMEWIQLFLWHNRLFRVSKSWAWLGLLWIDFSSLIKLVRHFVGQGCFLFHRIWPFIEKYLLHKGKICYKVKKNHQKAGKFGSWIAHHNERLY